MSRVKRIRLLWKSKSQYLVEQQEKNTVLLKKLTVAYLAKFKQPKI